MISADTAAWQKTAALLKTADKKVAAAMRKSLREVAKPIGDKVATEGAAAMPHRGGLSAYLAANAKPTISLAGKDVTIKLQDKRGGVAIKAMDRGKLRHPVFSMRTTDRKGKAAYIAKKNGHYSQTAKVAWVQQSVPEKAWTDAFPKHKDEALASVHAAVQKALDTLGEGAK